MRRAKCLSLSFIALVLASIAVMPMTAAAATPQKSAAWEPWMSIRTVVENPSVLIMGTAKEWSYPALAGNTLVYSERLADADGTGPGTSPGDYDLYYLNLLTGAKTAIDTSDGEQIFPRISGSWVVYADNSGGLYDIKAFNISTGQRVTVSSLAGNEMYADIDGTTVVYEGLNSVRQFNLTTGASTVLVLDGHYPSISAGRVVYRTGAGAISLLDTMNGSTTTVIAATSSGFAYPRIDGDNVIYASATADLMGYKVGAAAPFTIASADSYVWPDVSGTIGVATVYPSGGGTPYLGGYDFQTGKFVKLADADPDYLFMPTVSGNRVGMVQTDTDVFGTGYGDIKIGTLSAPIISASTASKISYYTSPKITGSVTENGIALGGAKLDVLKSTDGGRTWVKLSTVTASSSGAYSYTAPKITKRTWYRVRYNGATSGLLALASQSHFSSLSSIKSVMPYAAVGKPAGYPSTARRTKYYSTYGSLRPRQTASSATAGVVTIKCYRKVSGKYVLKKTYKARVYNYDTYSRYRASVKLPYSGRWRIRAYFKGSTTNAAAYSTYKYVTVY